MKRWRASTEGDMGKRKAAEMEEEPELGIEFEDASGDDDDGDSSSSATSKKKTKRGKTEKKPKKAAKEKPAGGAKGGRGLARRHGLRRLDARSVEPGRGPSSAEAVPPTCRSQTLRPTKICITSARRRKMLSRKWRSARSKSSGGRASATTTRNCSW